MKLLSQYGLHHVGYVVKSREEAIELFSQNFQITSIKEVDFKPDKVWLYGNEGRSTSTETAVAAMATAVATPYEMRIANLTLADHPTSIELIQPLSPGPHMDFLTQTGGGIHHVGIDVNNDYDHWKQYFEQLGAAPLFQSETEDILIGYRRCLYIKDLSGNIIEIKETPRFR